MLHGFPSEMDVRNYNGVGRVAKDEDTGNKYIVYLERLIRHQLIRSNTSNIKHVRIHSAQWYMVKDTNHSGKK